MTVIGCLEFRGRSFIGEEEEKFSSVAFKLRRSGCDIVDCVRTRFVAGGDDSEHVVAAAGGGEYAARFAREGTVEQFGVKRPYYLKGSAVAADVYGNIGCGFGLDTEE